MWLTFVNYFYIIIKTEPQKYTLHLPIRIPTTVIILCYELRLRLNIIIGMQITISNTQTLCAQKFRHPLFTIILLS